MKFAVKRLFTANAFPKGSLARAELNRSVITSEYFTSHPYAVLTHNFMSDGSENPVQPIRVDTCRTLDEANRMVNA